MRKNKILIHLLIFVLIEIIIVALWKIAFLQRQQATSENTTEITFVVDHVERHTAKRHEKIVIISNSTRYSFDPLCLPQDNKYNLKEIQERLQGQKITILYKEGFTIWGRYNSIVDIICGDDRFYSIDDFNLEQSKQMISGTILISIIQVMYIAFLSLYIIFIKDDLKKKFRKLKKKYRKFITRHNVPKIFCNL